MNHFPLKTKQKTPACHAYGGFFYCREGVNGPYPSRRYRGEPSSRVLMRLATASIQCASEEVSTGLSAGKSPAAINFSARSGNFQQLKIHIHGPAAQHREDGIAFCIRMGRHGHAAHAAAQRRNLGKRQAHGTG